MDTAPITTHTRLNLCRFFPSTHPGDFLITSFLALIASILACVNIELVGSDDLWLENPHPGVDD